MHSEVGPNGMVGLASLRKTGKLLTQHVRLICLRMDIESASHHRQESLKVAAVRFETLILFCHALMA